MHHHYQPPHLIEKDFGLSKDGKSTWSLRRRGRNAKTAQSSVGVGGTPTQPNFESRVRRSKFSQFARDGMLVMACIMQMFYPMNSMACIMSHDQLLTFENTRSAGCCPLLLCLKVDRTYSLAGLSEGYASAAGPPCNNWRTGLLSWGLLGPSW